MARPITWLATVGVTKNASGDPLAGGKMYAYTPGTTTQTPIWADADQAAILSQPVTLDAQGRTTLNGAPSPPYTEGPVKLAFYDSDDQHVFTIERANAQHGAEVEIENSYWNGTLSDGSTGAGGRTTLDAMATRIGESVGGADAKFKDPSGGTERALNAVVSEFGLSVKSKGALGNDSANDTQAFKDAIASLKTAGGGVLVIPPGTYRIDDALLVDFDGLRVVGAGLEVSIIKSTVTNKRVFDVTGNRFSVLGVLLTATGSPTEAAIYLNGVDDATVTGVYLDATFATGIHVLGASNRVWVTRCNISPATTGVIVAGSSALVRVVDCLIDTTTGVSIQGTASDVILRGCSFGAATTGVSVPNAGDGVFNVVIAECDLSLCTTAWSVVQTAAIGLRTGQNYLGAAATSDASSVDLASAATITLNGNAYYNVTGTTNIDHIRINHAYREKPVTLKFASTPTVNHNTATPPAGFAPILLAGAANFVATADDTLTLIFDGSNYREVARAVI